MWVRSLAACEMTSIILRPTLGMIRLQSRMHGWQTARNQPPRMQYGVPPQNEQFGAPAQAQAQQIADNMVAVTVPDGVYAGQEFYLIFNGMQIPVICPQGCGPGMNINLELDVSGFGGVGPNGSPQQQVQVTVPDGCFAGMFFTVDFGSGPFNVEVPEGYGPGMTFPVNMA